MYDDVTQHLEQQSDSHQYLERLRLENERVALQEKEREVYTLSPYITACVICLKFSITIWRDSTAQVYIAFHLLID